MNSRLMVLSIIPAMVFAAGCAMAPPANNPYPPQGGYQQQQGSVAPRGGYQQQMNQEQNQRNREAAGKLLPELMKLQDQMIKQQNQ